MKYELDFLRRGYIANRFRANASRLRKLAEGRNMSATKAELEAEAEFCDEQARMLDDAEEPATISEKEPIKADPNRDIHYMDAPKKEEAL